MRKLTSILLLTGVVALGLTACDDDEPTQPAPSIDQISVTPQSVTLQVGSTAQLAAQVQTSGNANPTVTWNSADTDVASVNNDGVVTGVGEGNTTVTATATAGESSKSASAAVTVNPAPPQVSNVSISPSEFTVGVGETTQLSATVEAQEGVSTSVTWSSSNEDVATVDEDGVVEGQSTGNVDITATSDADPSKSATASGTVQQANDATANISSVSDANGDSDDLEGTVSVTVQFDEGSQTITESALMVDDTTVATQTYSSEDIAEMISQDVFETTFEFNSAAFDEDGNAHFDNGEHDLKAKVTTSSGDTTADEVVATVTKNFDNSTTLAFTGESGLGNITFSSDTAKHEETGRQWIEGDASVTVKPVTYGSDTSVETIQMSWEDDDDNPATVNSGSNDNAQQTQEANDDGEFVFNWYNAGIGDTVDGTEIEAKHSIYNAEERLRLNADRVIFSDGTEETDVAESNEENIDDDAPDIDINGQDWVNADFNFLEDGVQDTSRNDNATDQGVQGVSFMAEHDGDEVETGDDLDESSDADDTKTVEYTASDLVNNDSTVEDEFGVDKTDPTIEYASNSVADETKFTTNNSRKFRVDQSDALSGLTGDSPLTKVVRMGPFDFSDGDPGFLSSTEQARFGDYDASDDELDFDAGGTDIEVDTSQVAGSDGDNGYYTHYAFAEDEAGNESDVIERTVLQDSQAPSASIGTPASLEGGSDVTFPSTASDNVDLDRGEFSQTFNGGAAITDFDPDGDGSDAEDNFGIRHATVDFGSFGTSSFADSESDWVTISSFIEDVNAVDGSTGSTTGSNAVATTDVDVESDDPATQDVAGNALGSDENADVSGSTTADADFTSDVSTFQLIEPSSNTSIEAGSESVLLIAQADGASSDPFDGGVTFYARAHDGGGSAAQWIAIGDASHFEEASNDQRYEFSWAPTEDELDRIQDLAGVSGDTRVQIVALGTDSDGNGLLSTSNENEGVEITVEEP